jgi:tagatose 1,6-diphosphate aldolase
MGHDKEQQLEDNLHALDAASERPWVLLSAGVDYLDYFAQVEMAMGAGASGILGGRAFWKEYFQQGGSQARSQFAATTARKRVADVDAIVRSHATPWFARYGFTKEVLASIRAAEGWHMRYGSNRPFAPGSSSTPVAAGEVY